MSLREAIKLLETKVSDAPVKGILYFIFNGSDNYRKLFNYFGKRIVDKNSGAIYISYTDLVRHTKICRQNIEYYLLKFEAEELIKLKLSNNKRWVIIEHYHRKQWQIISQLITSR